MSGNNLQARFQSLLSRQQERKRKQIAKSSDGTRKKRRRRSSGKRRSSSESSSSSSVTQTPVSQNLPSQHFQNHFYYMAQLHHYNMMRGAHMSAQSHMNAQSQTRGAQTSVPPKLDHRLQALLGKWLGRDGTRYELKEDTSSSLTVTTIRPNGQIRTTRGLVSAALDAYVRWGRNGQYYLEESGLPDNAIWCDARCLSENALPTRHVVFNWTRELGENGDRDRSRDKSCPPARGFGRSSRSRDRVGNKHRSRTPDHRRSKRR